jgi:hypothetical protein
MVKAVIVFVDVNGKKLDRGSEERDRDSLKFKVQRSMFGCRSSSPKVRIVGR